MSNVQNPSPAAGDRAIPCRIVWCDGEHAAPSAEQVYVRHEADVAKRYAAGGDTLIEIYLSWHEWLDGASAAPPEVVVSTHADGDSAFIPFYAATAGMLADVLALTGGSRWLAEGLATAAAVLGYTRVDDDPDGADGDVVDSADSDEDDPDVRAAEIDAQDASERALDALAAIAQGRHEVAADYLDEAEKHAASARRRLCPDRPDSWLPKLRKLAEIAHARGAAAARGAVTA